jgi:membrane protein
MSERSFDPVGRGKRAGSFLVAVVRRFYADNCLRHASALAYTTLLSLVPLLALMFSILKGLGVQRRLEPILLSRLALDPSVVEKVIGFIDNTNVGTLGALGAAALVLTVISVLGAVEATLNEVWRVRRGRTLWRKVTDYLSVFLIAPMLLLAGVAVTSSVQQQDVLGMLLQTHYVGDALLFALRFAPIVMNAIALGIIYAIMPNRSPRPVPILAGALVAGTAWQLVQWAYVKFQIGMAGYNAIYGALSQLPITLAWLYVSWAVVLLGAELAASVELGASAPGDQNLPRRVIALHVLVLAAERARDGGPALTVPHVARDLGTDGDAVSVVVERLAEAGWLAAVEGGEPSYILARDPAAIELASVEDLVGEDRFEELRPEVRHALGEEAARARTVWQGRTLADLLATPEDEPPPSRGESAREPRS